MVARSSQVGIKVATVLHCRVIHTLQPGRPSPVLGPGHLLEDPREAGGLDIPPQYGFYHLDTHG